MSDSKETLDANSPEVINRVSLWLANTGEVYVRTDYSHTGHSGVGWFIRSLADYRDLLRSQRNGVPVAIYRNQRYPLRGVVDEAFLAKALVMIKEGDWFEIVSIDEYPKKISLYGFGNSQDELRRDLRECNGMTVGFGLDIDSMVDLWPKEDAEALIVSKQAS
jgi:hypothetical protein